MDVLGTVFFAEAHSSPDLRGEPTDLAAASRNMLPFGSRSYKPFRNLLSLGAGTGSRRLFALKDGFGGLDDVTVSSILKHGAGSLYSHVGESLLFAGIGRVRVNGVALSDSTAAPVTASSVLKILLKWNGAYNDANSGPFAIGLPEPSVPRWGLLDNPPGETPTTNGNYHSKYARFREPTGGRSKVSGSTKPLTLVAKGAYMVIPLISAGQTHHIILMSRRGLGGIGLAYRLARANPYTFQEYTEGDVQRTLTGLTKVGADVLQSPTAVFTVADIGKRVNQVTGFTITNPTVVIELISATQIKCSTAITGAAGSVELISYVTGVDRAVPLNWKESDLTDEAEWIWDYVPPACSHSFALGNRIWVAARADSRRAADSDNPGTALYPSLPNQLESFDVRYPIYIPSKLVDVLQPRLSAYAYLGCRNGIYAIVPVDSEYAPGSITEILPTEGIKTADNWAISKRALYVATAKAKILRILEGGQVDTDFADPILRDIQNWEQDDIIISAGPKNDGVLVAHKTLAIGKFFNEAQGRWSSWIYLNDDYDGEIVSAVAAQSRMLISLYNGNTSSTDLYEFDAGTPSDVVGSSPYLAPSANMHKIVQGLTAQFETDRLDRTAYIALHRNNLQTFVPDASITGALFQSASGKFAAEHKGGYVLMRTLGGKGDWRLARIKDVLSTTQLLLGTVTDSLANSVDINISPAVFGIYALIAHRVFPVTPNRNGTNQVESPELYINEIFSFALSMALDTNGADTQPLMAEIIGTTTGERWNPQGSKWGREVP